MIVLLRDDIDDTFNDLQELKARILNESLPLPVLFSLLDPNLHILINSITLESPNQDLEKILELIEQQQGFEKTVNVVENYILEIYKILDKYENTEKLRSLVKTRD
jgi:geranylgeranyl pyrophosphate synthase